MSLMPQAGRVKVLSEASRLASRRVVLSPAAALTKAERPQWAEYNLDLPAAKWTFESVLNVLFAA